MNALLTDDEVIAIAVSIGTPWPVPLLTVPSDDPIDVAAASSRGLRSLAVRGMIDLDARGNSAITPRLVDLASRVIVSTGATVSYIARLSSPAILAGTSVAVFQGDAGVIVDSVTVSGIHALRDSTPDEGRRAIADFAQGVFDKGVLSAEGTSDFAVFVSHLGADFPSPAVAISKGTIAVGQIDDVSSISATFSATDSFSEWRPELIDASA